MEGIDENVNMNLPIYQLQAGLIPSVQIKDAISQLKLHTAHDSSIPGREQLVERYKITLENLTDHIHSPKGAESLKLSYEDSKALMTLGREGKFDPARYDITLAKKIDAGILYKHSIRAGFSAAIISGLVKAAPQIFEIVNKAITHRKIEKDDLFGTGRNLASGGSEGFIRGIVCAMFIGHAQMGTFGESFQDLALQANSTLPTVTAILTTLLVETVKDGIRVSYSEIDAREFTLNFEKRSLIAIFSYAGGTIAQGLLVEIPMIGYLVGSMIGSVVGALVFQCKESIMMSLCVQGGYTFFGLVGQDYSLPKEILDKIGVDSLEYEIDDYDKDPFSSDSFESSEFEKDEAIKFDYSMIKRGVIGVRNIGYLMR